MPHRRGGRVPFHRAQAQRSLLQRDGLRAWLAPASKYPDVPPGRRGPGAVLGRPQAAAYPGGTAGGRDLALRRAPAGPRRNRFLRHRLTRRQAAGPMSDDQFERGLKEHREVKGDATGDRALASDTPDTAGFQDHLTRYAWGDVSRRPRIDRKT